MWPWLLAAGGVFAWLFGSKPKGATGPDVLAKTTSQFGQPAGVVNWIAPSGRLYRVAHWLNVAAAVPGANMALALGGAWAGQIAPSSYWLGQYGAGGSVAIASLEPDATSTSDFNALRASLVG
jgi:hypothetical protein